MTCFSNVQTLIQGDSASFVIKARQENGDPQDLTSLTEATIHLLNADGSTHTFTKTGGDLSVTGNAILGVLTWVITPTVSALLATANRLTFYVHLNYSGTIKTVIFTSALNILATS